MKKMEIRNATLEDLQDIFEISLQQFGDKSWSKNQFAEDIEKPDKICLVATKNKKPISYISVMTSADGYEILSVATTQNEKRKGIASLLVLEIEKKANNNIFLEVRENNVPAICLYKKLGFNQMSIRKNYYGNGINAIIMVKNDKQN